MRRLALLLLLTFPVVAQVNETITVERILVDARVTDGRGNPILDLAPADFRVRVDGKPAKVESVDWIPDSAEARDLMPAPEITSTTDIPLPPPPRGRLLIYLFQNDFARNHVRLQGHMKTLAVADSWLDWLEPEDRVAVFTFDSHLKFLLDFTSNKAQIRNAMDQSLYTDEPPPPPVVPNPSLKRHLDPEAMRAAKNPDGGMILIAQALSSIPGPKSLILFGWGLGRLQRDRVVMDRNYGAARQMLEASRVSVFSVDFTEADSHSLEVGLQQVAADTGGFYTKANYFPKLAAERLQKTLAGHYELEVRKPETKVRGAHTIEVDVNRRGADVMARSTYVDK
jgi:VWFA-related protein